MRAGLFLLFVLLVSRGWAAESGKPDPDSLCTHRIIRDSDGKLLSWYMPGIEGAGYGHVVKLASEFIRNEIPSEPVTGMKLYFLFCEFAGPESGKDFFRGTTGRWSLPHNPACVFAGFTESFAVKYRVYSGDESYLEIVRECLQHMLKKGTTPSDWKWGNCPYASSHPGSPEYKGTGYWEPGRGDGEYVLEPDKVGEMGVAYLQFYEITEEPVYLEAALHCADALARNVREGHYMESPWPWRVHARTGVAIDHYCSNVIPAIKLFDELITIADQAMISPERVNMYRKAGKMAWDWLFSAKGPMKTYVWKGYFEDTPIDQDNENRVQITPLEVARYLIQHPETTPYYRDHVTALIRWCKSVFGTDGSHGYNAQCEQLICYRPMGSHSARYASVCAMWYNLVHDEWYKSEAVENFNWATYCTSEKGCVSVGTGWAGSWFSDGYGDYVRHFLDGMAAIPEWVPAGQDRLLSSTSVVQSIQYTTGNIRYKTYMPSSVEVLRLSFEPGTISADGKTLIKTDDPENTGWTWQQLQEGGVVRIRHTEGRKIQISR